MLGRDVCLVDVAPRELACSSSSVELDQDYLTSNLSREPPTAQNDECHRS